MSDANQRTGGAMGSFVKQSPLDYETIAAGVTGQVLGAKGAAGDFVNSLVCVVATAATSTVTLIDGSTSIVVLPAAVGGGVGTYTIPLGITGGPWSVTTGAGVSVVATGLFT